MREEKARRGHGTGRACRGCGAGGRPGRAALRRARRRRCQRAHARGLADSEALLLRARDPAAPKLTGNAAMMKLVRATDSRAALWGAGTIAPEVGAGLVKAAGDKVKQPASAMYGFANLDSGLAVELALQMGSDDDA